MTPETDHPVPRSGEQITLVDGEQRTVVVEVGGALRTSACGQTLVPWPNQRRDGRYSLEEHAMRNADQ